jgi:hypothetical protein
MLAKCANSRKIGKDKKKGKGNKELPKQRLNLPAGETSVVVQTPGE